MKTGGVYTPRLFTKDQQKPPLLPPQQHKSSSIQIISYPHPLPQPLFPKQPPNPLPPQQHKIRMSQMILHPFPPLWHPHPQSHPQFVAVKSLMRNPPCFSIQFTVCRRYIFVTGEIQILRTDPVPHNPIPD